MEVSIDEHSGFCFGVVYAIQMAEDELNESGELYCLGDIVHNNMEVERLRNKGLKIINHEELSELHDCKVLIRAHGEPPSTYATAAANNIELIDASCPVVLKLQNRIREGYSDAQADKGQIVIYGKQGHAEVNGLIGQTQGDAIVVMEMKDLEKVDFGRPVQLYSQTTKSTAGFVAIRQEISSNGKILFDVCLKENPRSHFISEIGDLDTEWLQNAQKVGICGATSTPRWLMEDVKRHVEGLQA
jgi:4-hydroxy-3-methylbut-2-enyl diphosphate reductase